ncbi:MAG: HAMP domain-containing sensor histidine kinase, partial [Nitrososphaeraceae archaeon]|nr:HAMP domain-containing sensor histidine kinase [Nitrososphaeraceae archaeon]
SKRVKFRCITEFSEDNIEQCRQLMSIAEVRHLPKVSGILLVTDKEFFSDIDPLPFSSSSQLLYSCLEEVVKKQLDTFESIWNKAVSGEKKIAELEKGTVSKVKGELTDENEIKFRMRERIRQMEEEKDQIETRIIETRTQFHNFIISSLKDTIERDWYFQEEILRRIYENYFELFKENIEKTLLLKNMNQNSKSKSSLNKKDNIIGLRCILKITRENMELVAKFLDIEGVYIRHTSNPLPINFEVSDTKFNLSMRTSNKIDTSYVLSIPDLSLIKYYKSIFEDLWNEGLDARIKIKDMRSNLNAEEGFTELIENPYKTQELLIHHIQKATKEILIILPSINAFFRYRKIGIFNILEKKLLNININNNSHHDEENSNKLLVKILTPTNNKLEKNITNIYNRIKKTNKQKENIEFRRVESLSEINTACIIIDKKDLLVIELKDDSKDNFLEAIGSSIYSNTPTTVFSYISIFDTLWTQTELYESIRIANDELQSTTEELRESLQILANVNQELTITNEILNKHDRMQKEFINVAAHELRTPTQSIIGYCEMIDAFPENTQKYLEPVKRNAEKLYRLTEDILDVSRIESGTLKLEKSKFDLREIIVNLIEDLTAKMKKEENVIKSNKENTDKKTNIQLIYPELSAQPLFVYADKNRIQQVLSNLLSNALKFTEDGVITINTETFMDTINNNANNVEKEFVSIKIKDTGKGIDPEVLPRLFEKFATKSDKGTGLGLYISKNIIDAHGGKIWGKDNNTYGKNGAEFSFTLPLYNI